MSSLDAPIVVDQIFEVSKSKLWNALTQIDEMRVWYFPMLDSFEAIIGFETKFTVRHEAYVFPHVWRVTEVVEQERIAYEWTFEGYAGKAVSSFELSHHSNGSILKMTNTTLEPFPNDIPAFKRESGVAGWKYLLQESLKNYLEGGAN